MDSNTLLNLNKEQTKEQTIKIDVNSLLKKSLEGKNLSVLFETELQKKLVEPLFNNINEAVNNAKTNISDVNLSEIFKNAISEIKLDKNVISKLNTAFSDKINNIVTNINGINIENVRRDFEANIDKQFKSSFENVKVNVPKELKAKDLLDLLVGNRSQLNSISQYKIARAANNLIDTISNSVDGLNINLKKELYLKDVLDILIHPTSLTKDIFKSKHISIVNKLLNIIDNNTDKFALISAEPLTHKDLLSLLFDKSQDTASNAKKKYEQIINSISDKISNIEFTDSDDSLGSTSQKKNDYLAEYSEHEKGTIFTHKELSLSAETLNQIKADSINSFKSGDLLTNAKQEEYTKKIIEAFKELSKGVTAGGSMPITPPSSNTPILPVAGKPAPKTRTPYTAVAAPKVVENKTPKTSASRVRPTPRSTVLPSVRRTPTAKPPKLPTTPVAKPPALPTTPVAKPPIIKPSTGRMLGKIGTVAALGIGAYNYNEVNKAVESNTISKETGTIEKSKVVGGTLGGLAGAAAGVEIGAAIGALGGPIGIAAGAVIGSILGGIGVGQLGEKAGEKAAKDYLNHQKSTELAQLALSQPPTSSQVEKNVETSSKDSKQLPLPVQDATPSLPLSVSPLYPVTPLPAPPLLPLREYKDKQTSGIILDRNSDTKQAFPSFSDIQNSSRLNLAESAAANFDPLISFLNRKFEDAGVGLAALAGILISNSKQTTTSGQPGNTSITYNDQPITNNINEQASYSTNTIASIREAFKSRDINYIV